MSRHMRSRRRSRRTAPDNVAQIDRAFRAQRTQIAGWVVTALMTTCVAVDLRRASPRARSRRRWREAVACHALAVPATSTSDRRHSDDELDASLRSMQEMGSIYEQRRSLRTHRQGDVDVTKSRRVGHDAFAMPRGDDALSGEIWRCRRDLRWPLGRPRAARARTPTLARR